MHAISAFSLGLTGGIGSGKTTIANMFAELGASLVDTDLIAHELTAANGIAIEPIQNEFGAEFIQPDGAMDRAKMRECVFADPAKKLQLENILHPLIRQETNRAAKNVNGAYTIFVVPLLVESSNWRQKVSRILVVDCQEETQISRVMARNRLSQEQVLAIMRAQVSREQRLEAADDIIFNEGDLTQIHEQVIKLHSQYLQLAKSSLINLEEND
ncbi:dephospho-CoA kinase [Undibacterium sp. GrIS 1.2]|uniref:dephospho-CoA kinase n=1 Tax=Undibacterium sp. GrIS 1.2 TaxID=3143933 RepID=UPI003393337D